MPNYTYRCSDGHQFTEFLSIINHVSSKGCQQCGQTAVQIIEAPMFVKVAANVCYDSPIDGRPITSWQQRHEDLKRNGCTPYDPEQKTDYDNRIKQGEAELDKAIDAHVEESVAKMPSKKRAELWSELTEQGKTLDVVRTTHGG